jgi:prepilin-type N-terminal cleavage/methylation domain-containing protein
MIWCFRNRLRAMTLIEMVVAMAILVIVMAAVLPQFRCVQNSWAYKQSSSEILQNGRVLVDHLTANLSQANHVTAVSAPSDCNGFIEYIDNDGNTVRYDLKANGNVEFGSAGSLSELAGPVTKLRFVCYDINNLSLPTTDPNRIRLINVEAVIANAANPEISRSFTAEVLIRTNALARIGIPSVFDNSGGSNPALCSIDGSHHLCAYEGAGLCGYAAIMQTDTTARTVTVLSSYQYDSRRGSTPALAKIDNFHYLCAYAGSGDSGTAVILQINPSTWAISAGTPFTFDPQKGAQPTLAQIDAAHYLCAYSSNGDKGYAIILTVNIGAGTITKGTAFKFDNSKCYNPALAKIDAAHYLCTYSSQHGSGYAAILVTDITAGTVTKAASLEFETSYCDYPALAQIDSANYLCTYTGPDNDGFAAILNVSLAPPGISSTIPYEFDPKNGVQPSLIKIDTSRFLCAYQGDNAVGQAVILLTNPAAQKISVQSKLTFDQYNCAAPALSAANDSWFLCAYEGSGPKGYAVMLDTDLEVLP